MILGNPGKVPKEIITNSRVLGGSKGGSEQKGGVPVDGEDGGSGHEGIKRKRTWFL